MPKRSVVVTGVAPHSLGEAILQLVVGDNNEFGVIGIDRTVNAEFPGHPRLRQIVCDLNALCYPNGLEEFGRVLAHQLSLAVTSLAVEGLDCLVQCAGAYEYGKLLEHSPNSRSEISGVNVLGTTEVLHSTMSVNDRLHRRNDRYLTHILIGSYQGLYARGGRPLYAPSKSYGIDLCTSLVEGREVSKCIYLAPGPIDTPMLHRNHWVTRAGGPADFFSEVLVGPRETYRSIFVDCDERALESRARDGFTLELKNIAAAMKRYQTIRRETREEEFGILSPRACAHVAAGMLTRSDLQSGVYVPRPGMDEAKPIVEMAAFSSLDRRVLFKSAAVEVQVAS